MTIINESYDLVPIDTLIPHPDNPRQGDLDAIKDSIGEHGFYGAVVVQKSTGHILAGNHRWAAAKATGAAEVPVTWVDVDDDQARRILLVDNRTADLGAYDDELLARILADLAETNEGLLGTGYNAEDLEELLAGLDDDVEGIGASDGSLLAKLDVTVGEPKHQVQRGQVWHLGPHVLIIADILTEWPAFTGYLTGDPATVVFAPYPSPLLPFSERLGDRRLVMVQPSLYLAGHLLDKWVSLTGEEPTQEMRAAA